MRSSSLAVVGLKDLRKNINTYIRAVSKGRSFVVLRKSRPVFKISSVEEASELWEPVVNFTKIRKGGVALGRLLRYL